MAWINGASAADHVHRQCSSRRFWYFHTDGRAVTDIIKEAFPVSFDLGIRALLFAFIMGILLGIVAAV